MTKYEISIRFTESEICKEDLMSLARFMSMPLGKLSSLVKNGRISLGTLSSETFYSGVKNITALVNGLQSEYQLYSNDEEIEQAFLEQIVIKVSRIKLSDFR